MRKLCTFGLLFLFVVAAKAQTVPTFETPVQIDPFAITKGGSFSASHPTSTAFPDLNFFAPAAGRMARDIREAEATIAENFVGTKAMTPDSLTKASITGMLRSLDPHSNFYNAEEWRSLLDEQQSGYTGIGATIAAFSRAGVTDTYVISIVPDSPAARSLLRFGDKIVAVNGEPMTEMSTDFVRDKIRGESGSSLKLTVLRAATDQTETLTVKRGHVPQPSIPDSYMIRPGIGYIELSEGFTYTTDQEFGKALQILKAKGMTSLILDLRGNGGGIVDQAVKVAGRFLSAGTLILTQNGRSTFDNRVWRSTALRPETMPLVVLVDENTASASEIVAGAFQDDDRALIVGEKTFGKGLVQSVIDLPGQTGLTLTTARYLTPAGRSIQRDYTKMSLSEYFDHKSVTSSIDRPYFEARTVTDRKVFGGDGITPDEIVASPAVSDAETKLDNTIFQFVRDLINGRIAGHSKYLARNAGGFRGTEIPDMAISDSLLSAFFEFADRASSGVRSEERTSSLIDWITFRLKYDLAVASEGSLKANRIIIARDTQVKKAIEVIPSAKKLAELASITRRRSN